MEVLAPPLTSVAVVPPLYAAMAVTLFLVNFAGPKSGRLGSEAALGPALPLEDSTAAPPPTDITRVDNVCITPAVAVLELPLSSATPVPPLYAAMAVTLFLVNFAGPKSGRYDCELPLGPALLLEDSAVLLPQIDISLVDTILLFVVQMIIC